MILSFLTFYQGWVMPKPIDLALLSMIGILGGVIWGVGMSFNIIASEQAGPAIAYGLGQGATLVAAIWGVFIWKEFKDLPNNSYWLIPLMFLLFVTGISTIIAAKLI